MRIRRCAEKLTGSGQQNLTPIQSFWIIRNSTDEENGRSGEIRTPDPLVPNQMRYQTALHSVTCCAGYTLPQGIATAKSGLKKVVPLSLVGAVGEADRFADGKDINAGSG